MHTREYKYISCNGKQQLKGYESCHDTSGDPKSEGSTEDAQEDAEGFQQGHGFKAVAIVSCRLVCHNGAEEQIDLKHLVHTNKNINTEIGNSQLLRVREGDMVKH